MSTRLLWLSQSPTLATPRLKTFVALRGLAEHRGTGHEHDARAVGRGAAQRRDAHGQRSRWRALLLRPTAPEPPQQPEPSPSAPLTLASDLRIDGLLPPTR